MRDEFIDAMHAAEDERRVAEQEARRQQAYIDFFGKSEEQAKADLHDSIGDIVHITVQETMAALVASFQWEVVSGPTEPVRTVDLHDALTRFQGLNVEIVDNVMRRLESGEAPYSERPSKGVSRE